MRRPTPYDTLTWIPKEDASEDMACRTVGHCEGVVLGCIVNTVDGNVKWTDAPAFTDTILRDNVYKRTDGILVRNLNSQRQNKLYVKDRGFVASDHATFLVLDEYIHTVGTLKSFYSVDKASSTASFCTTGMTFPSWKLLVAHILESFEVDVFHDLEHRANVVCPGIYNLPADFFEEEE